jgi:hypothetical protein
VRCAASGINATPPELVAEPSHSTHFRRRRDRVSQAPGGFH